MNNIDNPKNAIGILKILEDDDEDLNIDDLERTIVTGIPSSKKDTNIDILQDYEKEINDLTNRFGVTKKPSASIESARTITKNVHFDKQPTMATPPSLTDFDSVSDTDDIDSTPDLLNWSPPVKKESFASDNDAFTLDDTNDDTPTTYYPTSKGSAYSSEWSSEKPQDEQLNRMTTEERKQDHVNKVLGSMDKSNDDAEFVQQEDEEDMMAKTLEQIDLLKSNLDSEGIDLSRIQELNGGSSYKEARSVLRILQIKNDRLRYCDFFEEAVISVAYGLEGIFNGQREIFGSKIDMTGYSDTVKVKLKRMRYDTSNFVSNIMQGYNISSGWRIALELIPSLFMYSRDRKMTAKDNLVSDAGYNKAIQDLLPEQAR